MKALIFSTAFTLVLVSSIAQQSIGDRPTAQEAPLSSWRIHIFNHMMKQPLFLHCKSKDDDLGGHNLQVGQQYSWSFKENLLMSTLFWCYMHNKNSHVSFEVFWPETSGWLAFRCGNSDCNWSVRDDGIYLKTNSHNTYERLHRWEPGQRI